MIFLNFIVSLAFGTGFYVLASALTDDRVLAASPAFGAFAFSTFVLGYLYDCKILLRKLNASNLEQVEASDSSD